MKPSTFEQFTIISCGFGLPFLLLQGRRSMATPGDVSRGAGRRKLAAEGERQILEVISAIGQTMLHASSDPNGRPVCTLHIHWLLCCHVCLHLPPL